ncbi:MAG: 2-hydroxychromene-2-carboxylate isomerase [Alphaproteobacteria bacterium]|nr:2-hydroxychromene-2-carboxylate isomerase [Alphaproteobacteria bacterium]
MASTLEFWFEFASTYSYPAAHAVEAAAKARGVPVTWRAFLLGPIFGAQGWNDSPFNIYPAKGAYMWRDLARLCAAQGLPLTRPSQFPRNGLLAARISCRFADEAWLPEFVRRVYSANFSRDLDISSPFVIGEILSTMGQNAAEVMRAAQAQESKDGLRVQTEKAVAMGLIGAPSYVVDGEVFWGGDRLGAALDWATGKRTVVEI